MANFKEYLAQELNKTTDEKVKTTRIIKESNDTSLDDVVKSLKPEIWTAREIKGVKFLFFGGKMLNITELKKEIDKLYRQKGYTGYGFAKLTESDLVRYTKVKDIIIKCFSVEYGVELSPVTVANQLFTNELKEFAWKPEEY